MGVPAYLFGVQLWSWVLMTPFYLGGHADFKQIYAAASMLRAGEAGQLYDPVAQEQAQNRFVGRVEFIPFVRPAYELLLFLPLTFFRYRTAYFILLAANICLLALTYRLLRPRMLNLATIFPWLPAALFLAYLPIAGALMQGQDSVLLLLLLTAALTSMDKGMNVLAGFLVGLGMFKLQICVPLTLIFLIWRQWKVCGGVLLSALPVGLVSVWLTGYAQLSGYIRMLIFMGRGSPVARVLAIDHMTNLHGLVYGLLGTRLSSGGIFAITVLLSAILFAVISTYKPSGSDDLLLALMASSLLSYYLFFHDDSVLFLPIVIALDRFLVREGNAGTTRVVVFASLLFVFPLLISYAAEFLYLMAIPLLGLLTGWLRIPSFSWAGAE